MDTLTHARSLTLSIVIPCYNAERYIVNCLDSLLLSGKGCEGQYEVVVINDGSTDSTAELLAKYGGVKVVATANQGVSAARNRGLQEARGEYVWFVDADDDVEPEAVPLLLQALDKGYADGVIFNFEYVKNEKKSARLHSKTLEYRTLDEKGVVEEIATLLFGRSQRNVDLFFRGEFCFVGGFFGGGAVWQYVLNRDLLIRNGLLFREELPMGEDVMFLLRFLCIARKIGVVSNLLYNYYERPFGSLVKIQNNPALLFESKMKLAEEREVVNALYMERHGRDMSPCYDGSLMFSAMDLCIKLSRESCFRGMKRFLQYALLPSVRKAVRRIDTSQAPLKYKVPIRLLQAGFPRTLYTAVYIVQRLGYKINV